MNTKIPTLIFSLLLLTAIFSGCAQTQTQAQNQNQNTSEKISFTLKFPGSGVPVIEQTIQTTEGTTLFDAMQEKGIQMKYQDFSFGKMITGIGIIEPSQGEYFALYVNGKYVEKGVSDLIPKENDLIEFRIEQIQPI